MKVYIICFDNEHIRYPKVFLDRELAEKRLQELRDRHRAEYLELKMRDYSHWLSVDEMEVEQ